MSRRRCRRTSVVAVLGLVAGCLAGGCGPDGPQRYDVSGKVTFGGKPIPAGSIQFMPDRSKQNRGPAGCATIRDGVFDTRDDGRGCVGGPHRVVIQGFDGQALVEQEMQAGRPLFSEYRTTVDLPKEAAESLEFDVPASHR